ncbi:MAG TPA: GAF domain-containing protein [Bryobacteraceae bacterium]|nr:GAF domain-containing protein [Bryobacteraceae bacterium]
MAIRTIGYLKFLPLALLPACAWAQEEVSLEQAGSRNAPDFAAAYEGRQITVRAQIAAPAVWAYGTYYLALRDASEHGLILRGEHDQFSSYEPGDWVEVHGKIESRAGLPLLTPTSIEKVRHSAPPPPKSLRLAEAANLRYLGLPIETGGKVVNIGQNAGGTIVQLSDGGASVRAFLPRSASATADLEARVHVGDRVQATGLLTQYAPRPPFNGDFQIMLAAPGDLKASRGVGFLVPLIIVGALALIAVAASLWWMRKRRAEAQYQATRTFHTLCEEIISASSPPEIAEKLMTVLPSITQATGAWLYIFNRRTKSLHRVPTPADPEPVAVPAETQQDDLVNGAAACFQSRAQLNIPDVRRSKYQSTRTRQSAPRSAMIVPLATQGDVLGVLEAGNADRLGFFSTEEQASIQHLANQVAAALKLQEQRAIREQLFRSEKLAATGQLISGVANELQAPLAVILHLTLQLATQLASPKREPVSERDLRMLAGEAQRASEIVSRLVSFARPEDSETRDFDVNALLAGLARFREPEWKALQLRLQNRLSPEAAFVVGVQGQIEQVFLNLLVHAEQSAAETPAKTIAIGSSVIAGRVLAEIGYSSSSDPGGDPFAEGRRGGEGASAVSLDVCRTIVNSHGGTLSFSSRGGLGYFALDLPLARAEASSETAQAGKPERALTLMLVDTDAVAQRQLLGLLSVRGHRAVPAAPEEAADLAQRLRFDAVFWAMRASGPSGASRWSEFQERTRDSIGSFVLVSDGYDAELARSIEEGGNFLLGRPVQDGDLDRILRQIGQRAPLPARH